MKKRALLLTLLVGHFALGCSFLGPRTQKMTIVSDPDGAEVFVDGVKVGTTPLETRVHRRGDLSLMVKRDGCRTEARHPGKTFSRLGFLDLAGGALILLPAIGLLSSAAWEHEPDSYTLVLDCEPADEVAE